MSYVYNGLQKCYIYSLLYLPSPAHPFRGPTKCGGTMWRTDKINLTSRTILLALILVAVGTVLLTGASEAAEYEVTVTPEQAVEWVFPNATVDIRFTVRNIGDQSDSYNISVAQNGTWSFSVIGNGTWFALNSGESADVTIRVWVPGEAVAFDSNLFLVEAVSDTLPGVDASNTMELKVLEVDEVRVEAGTTFTQAAPGEDAYLDFVISNLGNRPDNYKLSAVAQDKAQRDWIAVVVPNSTGYLTSNEYLTVQVIVTVPESTKDDIILANTVADVVLTATSVNSPLESASANSRIRVEESYGVDIDAVGPKKQLIEKGGTAIYNLNVHNVANFDSIDTFNLTFTPVLDEWSAKINRFNVTVEDNGYKGINVTVTARLDAENISYELVVRAESGNDQTRYDEITLTTELPQEYEVKVTATPLNLTARPNQKVTFNVTVSNLGNGVDTIGIDTVSLHGFATDHPNSVTLSSGANHQFELNATVSSGMALGTIENLIIIATCEDNFTYDQTEVKIRVRQGFGIDLEPDQNYTDAEPGVTMSVEFFVENTGNGNDTFDLSLPLSIDEGWSVSFRGGKTVYELNPGEKEAGYLEITPPDNSTEGMGTTIHVNGTSRGNPNATEEIQIVPTVIRVSGVAVKNADPASGGPGGYTHLNFTVNNSGNGIDSYNVEAVSEKNWIISILEPDAAKDIPAGLGAVVQIRVFIPDGTKAGVRDTITLTVRSKSDPDVMTSAIGVVSVDLVTGIMLEPLVYSRNALPNEPVTFDVKVYNTGNGRENISLAAIVENTPAGWSAEVTPYGLDLDYGGSQWIVVTVTPAYDLTITTETAILSADADEGDAHETLRLSVRRSFIMVEGNAKNYLYPDTDIDIRVGVMNFDPFNSAIYITVSDSLGWSYNISSNSTTLNTGNSEWFDVTVHAPVNVGSRDLNSIDIEARLNSRIESENVFVQAIAVDMVIEGLRVKGEVKESTELDIMFRLFADGEPVGVAEYDVIQDVDIEVFLDGKLIAERTIDVLSVGNSTPVEFHITLPEIDWTSKDEEHTLIISIVSNKYENFKMRSNNEEKIELGVRDVGISVYLIPFVVIGLIVSVASFMFVSSRLVAKQRLKRYLLLSLIVFLFFVILFELPITGTAGNYYGRGLAIFYLLGVVPFITIFCSVRIRSYIMVPLISSMMFFGFIILITSGQHDIGYFGDVLFKDGLPGIPAAGSVPTFVYYFVPLLLGLAVVYTVYQRWYGALEEYESARHLIERIKGVR